MSLQQWLAGASVVFALAAFLYIFRYLFGHQSTEQKTQSDHSLDRAVERRLERAGTVAPRDTGRENHHSAIMHPAPSVAATLPAGAQSAALNSDHTHGESTRVHAGTHQHSHSDEHSDAAEVHIEKARSKTEAARTGTPTRSHAAAGRSHTARADRDHTHPASMFSGRGAILPMLGLACLGLVSCQVLSTGGVRSIPMNFTNMIAGGTANATLPTKIEVAVADAADLKAKANEVVDAAKAKVAEVAEKAVEAATPAKAESAVAAAVEPGVTAYYGTSGGTAVAAWAAAAVMNPDYAQGDAEVAVQPAQAATEEAAPEAVAETAPAEQPVAEMAKVEPGVTAYYGVAPKLDSEHAWAAGAVFNSEYTTAAAEVTQAPAAEPVEDVREPYKTEPGVTTYLGDGKSWQAPANYYALAEEPAAVAAVEDVREPYKTEPGVTTFLGDSKSWQAPENYYAPVEAPAAVEEVREPYKAESGVTSFLGYGKSWQAPDNYYASAEPPCSDALAAALKAGQLKFQTSSWEIDSDSYLTLDNIAKAAKSCGSAMIEVAGHTDNTGKPPSNKTLSELRAQEVMKYLVRAGVTASKMKAVGYGQDKPIGDNGTREGKAQNRRIEFVVTAG